MKKAFFAFVSMLGLAVADTTVWNTVYESTEDITLGRANKGVALQSDTLLQALDGCFISKVGSDTSPAVGKLDLTFTLTNTSLTTTLVTFAANSSTQAGWGVTVNNGSLYLGQMTVNSGNTTSAMASYTSNCSSVGTVTTDTTYTLSVISTASTTGTSGAVSPGRGIDNFLVTLSDGSNTTTTTVAGFGLNGSTLNRIYVGGSNSMSDTGTIGTVSQLSLSIPGVAVPEPATATLSLLALVGLAARRRR